MKRSGPPRRERLGVALALVSGELVAGDVEVEYDPAGAAWISAVGLDGTPLAGGAAPLLLPGLVDLQINGFGGIDFRATDVDGYATAAAALATRGVTAFAPTLHSQSIEDHLRSLSVLGEVHLDTPTGARILPAHMEGPFLAERFAGAHDVAWLRQPDRSVVEELLDAGPIGFVTLAPELPGALDVVAGLTDAGVVVSVGHTDASAAECRAAFDAGARHLTHCWNGHRGLSAREPGPAGAAIADDRIAVGLIADGVHVAAEVVGMTMCAAPERVAVTCDSLALAGRSESEWARGSGQAQGVRLVEGVARLEDGTIAGGAAGPDDCLRFLVEIGVDLASAADACGGAQRRLLGLDPVELAVGERLDAVVVDDAVSLRPLQTHVDGHLVWRRA